MDGEERSRSRRPTLARSAAARAHFLDLVLAIYRKRFFVPPLFFPPPLSLLLPSLLPVSMYREVLFGRLLFRFVCFISFLSCVIELDILLRASNFFANAPPARLCAEGQSSLSVVLVASLIF